LSRWLIAGSTCAGLLVWPVTGNALGLGAVAGEATIGEALMLQVPLTGTLDRPLESSCFSLRRVPDGLDAEYFPRDLVARVDTQAGSLYLQLSSHAAVRQPIVEFRVFVACGHNLFRDYLIMAAPRGEAPAPAATPARIASAPTTVPATATAATLTSPSVAAPVMARGNRLPDGIGGRNITLDREMTLEQLAQQHFPGPLRQQRFMRWVVETNPQYFSGSGAKLRQQRLPAGTALTIPAGVPPRRPGDHQGNVTPLGERIDAGTEGSMAPQAARTPASEKNLPKVGAPKDRLVVGGGSANARNLKEAVALVDQLTSMMEKQLSAQNSANERILQLETSLATLDKQFRDQEAADAKREAQWQVSLQAERAAREQDAQSAWWKILGAALAGGLVGGGLMLAWRATRGRKHDGEDEILDLPAVEEAVQVETPRQAPVAEPKATPLTEFGWDDEPIVHKAGAKLAAEIVKPVVAAAPKTPAAKVHEIDFELPASPVSMEQAEAIDPTQAAIELANIMTSMGLADSAAQTLVEHIRENPRESLPQWLKLLEIHRHSGNRAEFERSAAELRQHFNVNPDEWNTPVQQGRGTLESYPHIRAMVVKLWRTPECTNLLRSLLLDNREGTRNGFSLAVAEEILLLIAIQSSS
jgi:hypothetical protein